MIITSLVVRKDQNGRYYPRRLWVAILTFACLGEIRYRFDTAAMITKRG